MVRNIRVGAEFVGIQRKDVYELPLGSIREAICNAVCHRSYLEDDDVKVALYDDRLEIISPGGLFNGVTLEKIREGFSKTRNRGIANMLSYMRVIESWGSGIPRILRECKEKGLPEPSVGVSEDYVIVQLFRDDYYGNGKASDKTSDKPQETAQSSDKTSDKLQKTTQSSDKTFGNRLRLEGIYDGRKLNEYEKDILNLIFDTPTVSKGEMAAVLKMTIGEVKYYLQKLKNIGLVKREGANKNGKWIVNEELIVEE